MRSHRAKALSRRILVLRTLCASHLAACAKRDTVKHCPGAEIVSDLFEHELRRKVEIKGTPRTLADFMAPEGW